MIQEVHYFIDSSLVKKIKGRLDTSHSFSVKIANGGKVNTIGSLGAVSLKIQDYQCITDLYAMAIGGCDVVLGVQWLHMLGPVLWDFDKMYMKFQQGNLTYYFFSPETNTEHIQDVSSFQMEKLLQQESSIGAFLFQLQTVETNQHYKSLTDRKSQELH